MSVSVSLALYFAERNKGPFGGYFMTFESNPHLIKVEGATLRDKMYNIERAPWGGSTDLQAAFDLILKTAIKTNCSDDDMPKKLIIISDMEFNQACHSNKRTNFEQMKRKFKGAGFTMPEVIFWNVNSRNPNCPVTKDEQGTILVSGCSPVIFKQALNSAAKTPQEYMVEILEEKYPMIKI